MREVASKQEIASRPVFCAGGVLDAGRRRTDDANSAPKAIFVGSGIFKSQDPATFARAIVDATTHFNDPAIVVEASKRISKEKNAMEGLDIRSMPDAQKLSLRGN